MLRFPPDFVLLITGATGPIGREIAFQAACAGARVAVHGRTAERCEDAIASLQARCPGGTFCPAPADLLDMAAGLAMIDAIAERFGRIDALVNCAMWVPAGISGPFAGTDPLAFAALAQGAVTAFQTLCHGILPHLASTGGAVVALSSDAGRFAAPRQALVGSARAALTGFVRNLAVEIARDGIRINAVSLTWVADTPIFERFLGRDGRAAEARRRAGLGIPDPADIAPLVLFLCSASTSKVTGQEISINGGLNA